MGTDVVYAELVDVAWVRVDDACDAAEERCNCCVSEVADWVFRWVGVG